MKFGLSPRHALVCLLACGLAHPCAQAQATLTVDTGAVLTTTAPDADTGVTYNQNSPDRPGHDAPAARAAEELLRAACRYQNAQFISWGMPDPEPNGDPGKTGIGPDWSKLNSRLQMMVRTGASPIITFCAAPAWMTRTKGVANEQAPIYSDREPGQLYYVNAFATLCEQCAAFFNGANGHPCVKRFQVWNEFKGMFDHERKTWDGPRYTVLYNAVYTAVKAVRPDALIGGPYIVLGTTTRQMPYSDTGEAAHAGIYGYWDARFWDAAKYWLSHKIGADFIVLDGHASPKDWSTNGWPSQWNDFDSGIKFADAIRMIRSLPEDRYPGATTLPIDFAEWYCIVRNPSQSLAYTNAAAASHLMSTIEAGGGYALIWGPEGDGNGWDGNRSNGNRWEALWTATTTARGGQPTPFFSTLEGLHRYFPPGTTLYSATCSSPDILVMAGPKRTMLVNTTPANQRLSVNGTPYTLSAYQVEFVPTPGAG